MKNLYCICFLQFLIVINLTVFVISFSFRNNKYTPKYLTQNNFNNKENKLISNNNQYSNNNNNNNNKLTNNYEFDNYNNYKSISNYKNNNYDSNNYNSNDNYYCAEELCEAKHHVACNNNGSLSAYCPPDAQMIDVSHYHDLFVHIHNKYRSMVALGHLQGYKPAVRMATMSWDNELAKLAELNVKKCVFEHDECYNTKRFRNAGQCLAGIYYYPPKGRDMQKLITEAVEGWFSEHSLIDMSYVENFRIEGNFDDYGHFLEFVVDRNTHVGCAAIQFTDYNHQNFQRVNIACNYGSVYSGVLPVYEPGYPASKCKTGKNPKYQGLCSEKEKINPNYYYNFVY